MKDMFKKWGMVNFLAVIILAVILVAGGTLLGTHVKNKEAKEDIAGIESQATPEVLKTISYDGVDGKNALDLLKANHKVESQDSSMGSFVTSIDGTANTADTFWMFYTNGELAPSGADSYVTKSSDKIEWRFEKFQ